jgi:hypothetical protein
MEKIKLRYKWPKIVALFGVIISISMILLAFYFTPNYVVSNLSSGGILEQDIVVKINNLRTGAGIIGILGLLLSSLFYFKPSLFIILNAKLDSLQRMKLFEKLRGLLADKSRLFMFSLFAVTLISFAIRLLWVLWVQPPSETVFSDMAGYMYRAVYLLLGTQEETEKRKLFTVIFPFGVHYWYAFQLWITGKDAAELTEAVKFHFAGVSTITMAVIHALMGAFSATFTMLTAKRCLNSVWMATAVGFATAIWQPLFVYVGYYSSETPFAFLVALSLWLWTRWVQTGKGALAAGIATALGATVRPQMLLTFFLGIVWILARRGHIKNFRWSSVVFILLPTIVIVVFSCYRFHHYTGRIGLISDNGAIMRFFASTDYIRIKNTRGQWARPPSRTERMGFVGDFLFDSYISDATYLDEERERIWSSFSLPEKLLRFQRNIRLLAVDNRLWPEDWAARYAVLYEENALKRVLKARNVPRQEWNKELKGNRERVKKRNRDEMIWRKMLSYTWAPIMPYLIVPLAFLGMLGLAFIFNPALEIAFLHVFTMLYAAAMYFGELRYRVTYDSVLLLFAGAAIYFVVKRRSLLEKSKQNKPVTFIVIGLMACVAALTLIPF